MKARRVVLIGWQAADWAVSERLRKAGRMPNVERLLDTGAAARLDAVGSEMLALPWIEAVTGRRGPCENVGEPAARPTRERVPDKALWNLLTRAGLRSLVVGWPAFGAPEPIAGVYVSKGVAEQLAGWPEAGTADEGPSVPLALVDQTLAALRPLCGEAQHGLLSVLAELDETRDPRFFRLVRALARCTAVHAASLSRVRTEDWAFCAVHHDALACIGGDFGPPAAGAGNAEAEPRLHALAREGLYALHDAMLGALLGQLNTTDTLVMLAARQASPVASARGALRERTRGPRPSAARRYSGGLVIQGPGVKRGARLVRATLLDLAPTVLASLGLPVGRDMDGRALAEAFDPAPELQWVESWESPEVTTASSATAALTPLRGPEAALVASTEPGGPAADEQEALFHRANAHLAQGRPVEALPLLERLCTERPDEFRFELGRLQALSRLERHDSVLAWVESLEASGVSAAFIDLLAAGALGARGEDAAACARLARAGERDPDNPTVHQLSGDYHRLRGRHEEAETAYLQAMALDPSNACVHTGLAQVAHAAGEYERAADHAVASLRQLFWNPRAHFVLGLALLGLGSREEARRAFERAVEQAPGFGEAHLCLAQLLEAEGEVARAAAHRRRALGLGAVSA